MCQYYTYHWSCCPGTCSPAPYYMQSICPESKEVIIVDGKRQKCVIQHDILDGADYGEACPKCGLVAAIEDEGEMDEDDEEEMELGDEIVVETYEQVAVLTKGVAA